MDLSLCLFPKGSMEVCIATVLMISLSIFRGVFRALSNICDALRNLVPFGQYKKRENHPRRSAAFSEVVGF